jgi:exonuclease VII small subunit
MLATTAVSAPNNASNDYSTCTKQCKQRLQSLHQTMQAMTTVLAPNNASNDYSPCTKQCKQRLQYVHQTMQATTTVRAPNNASNDYSLAVSLPRVITANRAYCNLCYWICSLAYRSAVTRELFIRPFGECLCLRHQRQ